MVLFITTAVKTSNPTASFKSTLSLSLKGNLALLKEFPTVHWNCGCCSEQRIFRVVCFSYSLRNVVVLARRSRLSASCSPCCFVILIIAHWDTLVASDTLFCTLYLFRGYGRSHFICTSCLLWQFLALTNILEEEAGGMLLAQQREKAVVSGLHTVLTDLNERQTNLLHYFLFLHSTVCMLGPPNKVRGQIWWKYPLDTLSWPHRWSGQCEIENDLFPLLEWNPSRPALSPLNTDGDIILATPFLIELSKMPEPRGRSFYSNYLHRQERRARCRLKSELLRCYIVDCKFFIHYVGISPGLRGKFIYGCDLVVSGSECFNCVTLWKCR
jgi:hypothetical protein